MDSFENYIDSACLNFIMNMRVNGNQVVEVNNLFLKIKSGSSFHKRLNDIVKIYNIPKSLFDDGIIAGSFVAHIIQSELASLNLCKKPSWEPNDIDLWIYDGKGCDFEEFFDHYVEDLINRQDENGHTRIEYYLFSHNNKLVLNTIHTTLAQDCSKLLNSFDFPCCQVAIVHDEIILSRRCLYSFLTHVNIMEERNVNLLYHRIPKQINIVYEYSKTTTERVLSTLTKTCYENGFGASSRIWYHGCKKNIELQFPYKGKGPNETFYVHRADHFWYLLTLHYEQWALCESWREQKLHQKQVERILRESGIDDDCIDDILSLGLAYNAQPDRTKYAWGNAWEKYLKDKFKNDKQIMHLSRILKKYSRCITRLQKYESRGFVFITDEMGLATLKIQHWWRECLYKPGTGVWYKQVKEDFENIKTKKQKLI